MYKLIVIMSLILLSTLSGCVEDANQSPTPTQTENITSNTDVVTNDAEEKTILEDTKFIRDLAANHSVKIGSIEHYGDMVIVEMSSDYSQISKDFIKALNHSEHFLQDARFLSNPAEIEEAKIFLLPNIKPDIEKIEVETINEVKNTISGDIKFLRDLAAEHSVELRAVEHYGDMVFVEFSVGDSQQYKDFLNELNDSEHFSQDARILSNPSGSWKAKIFLQSNVEPDIDKIFELPDGTLGYHSVFDLHDKLHIAVNEIAEYKGLTLNPPNYFLSISKINTTVIDTSIYAIVSCELPLEGSKISDKILGFISSLDNWRIPIILTKVVYTEKEMQVNIGLDFYAYGGER